MSDESSELRLKALETSKEPPQILLGQAASIAGVEFDWDERCYQHSRQAQHKSTSDFREQWLLKWVLKKLNEALHGKSDIKQLWKDFLCQQEPWAFLVYLLSSVSTLKALEICLERNFATLMIEANRLLLDHHDRTVKPNDVQLSNATERPRKRRRVTPESDPNDTKTDVAQVISTGSAVLQLLLVLKAWGSLLQSNHQNITTSIRSVPPTWATSVTEASQLIGSVLTGARHILDSEEAPHSKVTAAFTIVQWLRLWQTYSTSNTTSDKTLIERAFNETSLRVCLDLHLMTTGTEDGELILAMKEIEKQIALNTVLPLRSIFNAKFAASWKKNLDAVSWQDIEPVSKLFQDQLVALLDTEKHVNSEPVLLHDSKWGLVLISIASRLVPKYDVRRRQMESTWLEALTICLAHLSFPRSISPLSKDPQGVLQPIASNLPPTLSTNEGGIDALLGTIELEDLHFSTAATLYIVTSILTSRTRPIPISLLSSTVNMNLLLFVPSVGNQNASSCLEHLLLAMSEAEYVEKSEYDIIIKNIIHPLMEAFAQARDIEGFLKIWQPKVEEALRVRASASFSKEQIPSALVWGDEDLFAAFSDMCKSHMPISFGRVFLDDTVQAVKSLSERVGSTNDIFAQLAVFESIVKGSEEDLLSNMETTTNINTLKDLLAVAIQQKSDYLGQRWRLWSLLTSLNEVTLQSNDAKSLTGTAQDFCERFHSLKPSVVIDMQQSQRSALLLEQHMLFSWLLTDYKLSTKSDNGDTIKPTELLQQEIIELAKMLEKHNNLHVDNSASQLITKRDVLWDGRANNLNHLQQLIDGQLASLLRLISTQTVETSSLSNLTLPLQDVLTQSTHERSKRPTKRSFIDLLTSYLARSQPMSGNGITSSGSIVESQPTELDSLNQVLYDTQTLVSEVQGSQLFDSLEKLLRAFQQGMQTESAILAATIISRSSDHDLKTVAHLPRFLASMLTLKEQDAKATFLDVVLRLELCMLTLKLQPGVVNQANIDTLLKDLAIFSSSAVTVVLENNAGTQDQEDHAGQTIFERLLGIIGILLAKHRRRLSGRSHLLLPVLQNLLKCFFYTSDKKYLYQNAATSKQRQQFRSSLPHWLGNETLPPSAAVRFSKLVSSICNPTTASARSAHRSQRKKESASLELNDETRKARRLAAQYMQYLIMEYARCNLDGVIRPEVREKLIPGLYSVLDAMDRELMKAMNAAMDPSSRAIFKSLYDDWVKHWKWDQS